MPFRDGTGPRGQGPITGKRLGPCGKGMGFGRGLKVWAAPMSKNNAKENLNQYCKSLEEELEQVKTEQKKLEEEK